ncbi:hypothetical protein V8C35DRAFT_317902 [Trichoderma chlorosporum]
MDSVNAVGIAATVVQFADFGFRLIKSAHELYRSPSGQKPEYIELSKVSEDLSRLADAIGTKIGQDKESAGEIFLRLHNECLSTNDEIQSILSKLKAKGSLKIKLAADGLRVAFKQVTAAGDIEKLAHRLGEIRQQMNVALLCMLLDEAGKTGVELRQFARQQADMIATLDRIDGTTKQFSTDIVSLIDNLPVRGPKETDAMVRYVLNDKCKANKYAKEAVFDESKDDEKLRRVRQSLYFESITHRETSIPKQHAATFEWIFHEPRTSEDGHALWSSFPLWLRGESRDIYWITGKPGAGKSTLVKFISQEARFKDWLQDWAKESQLLIIRFFAWTPGAHRLQKSQEGLFRTLLFEAIQQNPQLAINIFPARWFLLQSFNGNIGLPDPTMDELRDGFQNLLSAVGDKMKLVILIDGLDEFQEDKSENHRDLVGLLRAANAGTGVKICASSRPWNIFRDEYGCNPMLQLENLTREDIKTFVQERLQLSPGYSDFAATNSEGAFRIIAEIVAKSQGVFLWVSVISGLLEAALQEGTSISDLQATIDDLPEEVDQLFRYIWNRTSTQFRAKAALYFCLVRTCQRQRMDLFGLTLWFGDRDIPVNFPTAKVTGTYLTAAIKSLERRLMSRTGGLLELVSGNDDHTKKPEDVRVDYMHRTASDWVRDNWESISLAADPHFDPLMWVIKGQVLSVVLNIKSAIEDFTWLRDHCRSVFNLASRIPADHSDRGILVAALDRLDDHMARHMAGSPDLSDASHWVHRLELRPELQASDDTTSHLAEWFGPEVLLCTDFLEFCARIPTPAYLKHKAQENPRLFSSADDYARIMNNLIFGEIWSHNAKARLKLLKFLLQEKYCPWPEWFHMAKAQTERVKLIVGVKYPEDRDTIRYFGQVTRMLTSRVPQTAPEPCQTGDLDNGSSCASIAPDASGEQDHSSESMAVNHVTSNRQQEITKFQSIEKQGFLRRMFRRK